LLHYVLPRIISNLNYRTGAGVTSSFLVSLAIADVIFLLVCVPHELTTRMIEAWTGGRMLCKLYGYVDMLSAFASVLNLVAVSVERSANDSHFGVL
jgi:7 transmembrane receptor (rhodopsin family)